MTTAEFKKVARILKYAFAELEINALKKGIDITSEEYTNLVDSIRLSVLKEAGFTLEEYREAKELARGVTAKDVLEYATETSERLSEIDTKIPTIEDIKNIAEETAKEIARDIAYPIAEEVAKKYIVPPKVTNQIVKETVVKEPKIIKETVKVKERVEYNDKPLKKELERLEGKIKDIPVIDVKKLEKDFLKPVQSLKESIDMEWGGKIPDFRKLAMGIQSQIDELRSSPTGSGNPAGSNTEVQFNDGGSFGADSHFTYNKTTDTLHVHALAGDATDGLLIESESGVELILQT
jgi:DNA-binding transcriptional MerR regulator